jgi:hypothetical protein
MWTRPSLALAAALALAASPVALAAQAADPAKPDSAKSDSARRPNRLFRATEPVVMWLEADFKTVFKDRDSMSTKRYPATLRWLGEKGDTQSTPVQLATRGHFRLRTCSVPPLKVYFDKEKTKGTLFGGEGSYKLTSHCQKADRYSQNVFVEYATYGMYNALTPVSLKARLATITWVDPADPKFTVTRPGFWTEDEEEMAKRNKGKVLMQLGGNAAEMDPKQMALTDVFQYMIGNTDYSLSYLHNYRIIQTDTSMSYYPMAYDFDWSGLVNSPYAKPDYRLPIKRVTDRLYRGGCHSPELLKETIGVFQSKKDSILGQLKEIKDLAPDRYKEASEFLEEFYKLTSDPGQVNRELRRVCDR